MVPSESGKMVCAAETISKMGFSTAVSGSGPMIMAAAPKRACPTRESRSVSEGPREVTAVISEQMWPKVGGGGRWRWGTVEVWPKVGGGGGCGWGEEGG